MKLKATSICCIILIALATLFTIAFALFPPMQNVFVILFITGLMIVFFIQVSALMRAKKKVEDAVVTSENIDINTCPDFYVKTSNGTDGIICNNTYNTPDERYKYIFSYVDDTNVNPDLQNINIRQTFPNTSYREVCTKLNDVSPSNQLNKLAWTNLKSKCELYA